VWLFLDAFAPFTAISMAYLMPFIAKSVIERKPRTPLTNVRMLIPRLQLMIPRRSLPSELL